MKNSNRDFDVIVIGGGPAGLMAAGVAGKRDKKVLLLEKNSKCGLKLRITGKGSCNITNVLPAPLFLEGFFENRKFLNSAIRQFSPENLLDFFSSYNIKFKTINNFKIFPDSLNSQTIIDAMMEFCNKNGVEIKTDSTVLDANFIVKSNRFQVITKNDEFLSKSLIITTGGLSYPGTGSTGDGYKFAIKLGHSLENTRPGLVGIISNPSTLYSNLSGISLKDIPVTLYSKQKDDNIKKIKSNTADLLFTHDGLSGPSILYLSRYLPEDLENGYSKSQKSEYYFSLDLCSKIDQNALNKQILELVDSHPKKKLINILSKEFELPLAFSQFLIEKIQLPIEIKGHELNKSSRLKIISELKMFTSPIKSTAGYKKAMVTAGGIKLKEVSPKTMESLLLGNLYFAGEILDIDGNTGGYNLQAAFSTGFIAGKNA